MAQEKDFLGEEMEATEFEGNAPEADEAAKRDRTRVAVARNNDSVLLLDLQVPSAPRSTTSSLHPTPNDRRGPR